jgi:aspartate racemase
MKTIGLLAGMSWESSVTYYQIINETIREQLGGLHSAKILMYSVEFAEMEAHMAAGQWSNCAKILGTAAQNLEKACADFVLICTNTLHKVAPEISAMIQIPLLHIAEATLKELQTENIQKVALLGTKYTMEQDFYKKVLIDHNIDVMIPAKEDREIINDIIFKELCLGINTKEGKEEFLRIIGELAKNGAQGVIFGCTEIGLLVSPNDSPLPVFDTALIHAKQAALFALEGEQ